MISTDLLFKVILCYFVDLDIVFLLDCLFIYFKLAIYFFDSCLLCFAFCCTKHVFIILVFKTGGYYEMPRLNFAVSINFVVSRNYKKRVFSPTPKFAPSHN